MTEIREVDEIVKGGERTPTPPARPTMRVQGWHIIPIVEVADFDTFLAMSEDAKYKVYRRPFPLLLRGWAILGDVILYTEQHEIFEGDTEIEYRVWQRTDGKKVSTEEKRKIEEQVKIEIEKENQDRKKRFDVWEEELKSDGFIAGNLVDTFALIMESECQDRIRDALKVRR